MRTLYETLGRDELVPGVESFVSVVWRSQSALVEASPITRKPWASWIKRLEEAGLLVQIASGLGPQRFIVLKFPEWSIFDALEYAAMSLLLLLARAADARTRGDTDLAIELTAEIWFDRDEFGARATAIRAAALMQNGDLEAVRELLTERLSGPDPTWSVASCHRTLATIGLRINDFDMVAQNTTRALELLDPQTEPLPVAWSHYRLADLARRRGDTVGALAELQKARHYFAAASFPAGLGESMNVEGAIMVGEGRFAEARAAYEEAYDMLREAGSAWAVTSQLHMALAAIYMGDGESVDGLVTDLRDALRRKKFELFNVFGMLIECAVAAELGDTRRFDATAHEARERLFALQESGHDLRMLVDWIHQRWSVRGDGHRAAWFVAT